MIRTLLVLGISTTLLNVPGIAMDKSFEEFLKEYSSTIFPGERDSLLLDFWQTARQRGIPYIENNKTEVTFLYMGRDSVRVWGDFTSWSFRIPLRQLPESDLWYLKLSFEPDARLDYMFIVGRGKEILDPENPRIVAGVNGDRSELAMPDFIPAAELAEQKGVRKGSLTTLTVASKILNYEHRVQVYLPPGYDTSKLMYPVAYFLDGGDYINFGNARTVIDNLLATKDIPPFIGIFITPPTDRQRNRAAEYGMNGLYEKFITSELVPYVDKKFRTETSSSGRLLVGTSFGGLMALYIAFNNPEIFSIVASQSGFVSFRNDSLLRLFQQSPTKSLRLYVGVGSYEKNVGGMSMAKEETDILAANRRFSKLLEQKQYQFRYKESRDGQSWGQWRTELPAILRWFYSAKGVN